MCGIVGLITGYKNGFSHAETQMMQDMVFLDSLRGVDATGVMWGDTQNNVSGLKESSPSWNFLGTTEWKNAKSGMLARGKWAVAHNRAATRGAKNDDNAHPFVADHIVLVQNGTYRGSHDHHAKVDVDSHACAIALSKNDDVEAVLKTINAAYACVWGNHKDKTLNIIRNDERPLCIARTTSGGVAFASEAWMIVVAAERNKVDLIEEPYLLREHHLCKYVFDKGDYSVTYTDLDCRFHQKVSYQWSGNVFTHSAQRKAIGWYKQEDDVKPIHTTRRQKRAYADCYALLNDTYRNKPEDAKAAKIEAETKSKPVEYYIQGIDYFSLDPNGGTEYLVFGTAVSADKMSDMTVCWRQDSKSEKDMMGYAVSNFVGEISHWICLEQAGVFLPVMKEVKEVIVC